MSVLKLNQLPANKLNKYKQNIKEWNLINTVKS
jgi:hypothetical protein